MKSPWPWKKSHEAAARSDDELTMKYLEEGTLTHEELIEGFKMGMFSGQICPVVPCSALTGVGVAKLLDVMADFLPSPKRAVYKGVNPKTGEEIERPCNSEQPFSALVYQAPSPTPSWASSACSKS